jgi:hypothetical protein
MITSVKFEKSDAKNKRMVAFFYNQHGKVVKRTHFGLKDGSTYIDHKNKQKKDAWIARHQVRGTFDNFTTASSLSYYILWNKTSLQASINDYAKTFDLDVI